MSVNDTARMRTFVPSGDASGFFERGDVGAVHPGRDDPGVAARRGFREQERREQQQRGGGQHGHEHADAADDAGRPSAGEHEVTNDAIHDVLSVA